MIIHNKKNVNYARNSRLDSIKMLLMSRKHRFTKTLSIQ